MFMNQDRVVQVIDLRQRVMVLDMQESQQLEGFVDDIYKQIQPEDFNTQLVIKRVLLLQHKLYNHECEHNSQQDLHSAILQVSTKLRRPLPHPRIDSVES
mmetsp:Transcript_7606/g.12787  ORF Transcript_7606/g.12787 Transcript_7606/m.12787 type:complete len:100 (+) Transcript_7606:338-637(+)